jgi:hypothetical protein
MKKLDSFKVFQKTDKEEIIVNKVLIGYSRISSKQQESNYSIADQEKSLREYALQNNYEMREIICKCPLFRTGLDSTFQF